MSAVFSIITVWADHINAWNVNVLINMGKTLSLSAGNLFLLGSSLDLPW